MWRGSSRIFDGDILEGLNQGILGKGNSFFGDQIIEANMLTEAEGIKFPSCYKCTLYDGLPCCGPFLSLV